MWVYGDSYQNCLVAIVYPKVDNLKAELTNKDEDIATSEEARRLVLQDLETIARGEKRQGFEIIKDIRFSPQEFTPENDLATPTMKLKRPQLKAYFQEQIDEMYAEIERKEKENKPGKKVASAPVAKDKKKKEEPSKIEEKKNEPSEEELSNSEDKSSEQEKEAEKESAKEESQEAESSQEDKSESEKKDEKVEEKKDEKESEGSEASSS